MTWLDLMASRWRTSIAVEANLEGSEGEYEYQSKLGYLIILPTSVDTPLLLRNPDVLLLGWPCRTL